MDMGMPPLPCRAAFGLYNMLLLGTACEMARFDCIYKDKMGSWTGFIFWGCSAI